MKDYEKSLRTLLTLSGGGCRTVHLPDSGIPEEQARYLESMGLISLRAAWDNGKYVKVEPPALRYFDEKRERRAAFWREHVVNFIGGFISGVLTTLLAAWIISTWR